MQDALQQITGQRTVPNIFISGEHLVVREDSKEIVRRVIEYNRHLRRLSTPA